MKQALIAKAPPAESLVPAATAAAAGVRADVAAPRDLFIDGLVSRDD
jgi:hypothetical protein